MTSGSPSTPAKVAASAANYTPATLDPDLRSQINSLLIREGHVTKIQDHLLHSLNAHPTNWPTAVQSHALSLLRSGEATTFPALLRRVMDDVRAETALGPSSSSSSSTTTTVPNSQSFTTAPSFSFSQSSSTLNGSGDKTNGAAATTKPGEEGNDDDADDDDGPGEGKKKKRGTTTTTAPGAGGTMTGTSITSSTNAGGAGLAVPEAVVEEALRVTRECLESICEIEDGGAT